MKKKLNEFKEKTVAELQKAIQALNEEISLLILNVKVNPPKDTNFIAKKRRNLAVMHTFLSQKKEVEKK